MAGSKKGKKIKEIEYNVMNGGLDKNDKSLYGGENSGCIAVVIGVIIIAAICFFAFGFMHSGSSSSKICCAEKGCSRTVKSGSNYCWLHGKSSITKPRKKNPANTQNKDKTQDNSQNSWSSRKDEDKNEENNGSSSGTGSEKSSSDSSAGSTSRSNSGKVSY